MLPATVEQTWPAILEVLKDGGISTGGSREDGVLITRVSRWSNRRGLPEPGLERRFRPESVQLFIFVPPMAGPVRVYVNSRIEADNLLSNGQTHVFHDTPGIAEWFFDRLEARLGVAGHAIPKELDARKVLSRRLSVAGQPMDGCLDRAPGVVPAASGLALPASRIPRTFVRPEYDERDRRARRQGLALLTGTIQEDGIVTDLEAAEPADRDGHLEQAAAVAVTLWRFHPALVDGCPVPVTGRFEVYFGLR